MPVRFFGKSKMEEAGFSGLSDEQLTASYFKTREPGLIGVLYQRYTHLLFSVCYKYLQNRDDAEDAVMLLFEKLFDLLKKEEVKNFKSWAYTIAKNECLMQLRHAKVVNRSNEENLKNLEAEIMEYEGGGHLLSGNNDKEHFEQLHSAICHLNDPQCQCITLFYLEEKSYREVAELTGFSQNEVRSHLQNGRRNLKISLKKAGIS
jgi:RNA polymerase sigma-70 factor, ECF subfamily